MGFELSEKTLTAGFAVKPFASIGSTNAEALKDAQSGAEGSVWYVTTDQVSGRGRRGRQWSTQKGNLAATLLLVHDYDLQIAAGLSFVAGLSLAEAIDGLLPGSDAEIRLKWPNDVLADGAKLSGILLESALLANGRKALAIGIGVNVQHAPQDLPYATASLRQLGYALDAETLHQVLAERFADNFAVWDDGRGMDAIRTLWLQRAARLGETIRVQVGQEMVEGVFSTIDAEGHLVLRLPQNRQLVISAGEVFFGS